MLFPRIGRAESLTFGAKPGRHTLGRASAVHAGRLLPQSCFRCREGKTGVENREPFKTVLSGDREAVAKLSKDIFEIVLVTQSGMTVEEFRSDVRNWLATAKHPRWNRPYTELVYQLLLEELR
jgi:hypothetical protein